MGLLKAGIGAAGGVLADQWREYIYCDAIPADVLACKGQKRTGGRSSNTKGGANVISDGSIVAVNAGQAMLVVKNGGIVDLTMEPGEYVWDTGSEPSVFAGEGDLGERIKKSFSQVGRRFSFGADAGKDQRVYFFNMKEIVGNKYGTASFVTAQGEAMKAAAGNAGGAAIGFMGMNIAAGAGGMNANDLFAMQAAQQQATPAAAATASPAPAPAPAPADDAWTCSCGARNTGKFCSECGSPKPAPVPAADAWTCSCGTANTG